jgi:hypothetical protein
VLGNVHVQLIFWGTAWAQNPTPSPAAIVNAVQGMLAGPYMNFLGQYGVRRGSVRGQTFWTLYDPPQIFGTDPPGPRPFTFQDVGRLITGFIDGGSLPEPDEDWQILHCVVMPPNATFNTPNIAGQNGQVIWNDYDFLDVDNDPIHFCWVGNDGTLDYVTTVLSHELVEAVTDPNGGTGIVAGPGTPQAGGGRPGCPSTGSCQIGDVCNTICGYVRGVKVQAYWSESLPNRTCVLPTAYSVRQALKARGLVLGGRGLIQGIRSIQPVPPQPKLDALIAGMF